MGSSLPHVFDSLRVDISADRPAVGQRSALHVVRLLGDILARQTTARVMFACAPSQNEFLAELSARSRGVIDWARIHAFHMDEYVGLSADHPASFRRYLKEHLLVHLPTLGAFHPIRGEAADAVTESARYAALLDAAPLDLICLGIGENGHLAFNDPPVANFADPVSAKPVELELACRQQQVNDGCFASLTQVPTHAITVTLPVFRRARALSVVVPGPRKAAAVRATLLDPVSTACPATLLRGHPQATLFIDQAAAGQLG